MSRDLGFGFQPGERSKGWGWGDSEKLLSWDGVMGFWKRGVDLTNGSGFNITSIDISQCGVLGDTSTLHRWQ